MPTVLITGANRGIGLEFVRQYAADGWRVHAAARNPDKAKDLAAIPGEVTAHALDVTDGRQVAELAAALADAPIDLLINNAGVAGRGGSDLGRIDYDLWQETMTVNTLAPVRVAEAFAANLERGGRKLLVSMSSRMGSIAGMGGGALIYGASKAALNAAMKTLAADLRSREITVVVFHPGWVQTDMGGAGAPVTPTASVSGMRRVIDGLTPKDSGKFLDRDGAEIPW